MSTRKQSLRRKIMDLPGKRDAYKKALEMLDQTETKYKFCLVEIKDLVLKGETTGDDLVDHVIVHDLDPEVGRGEAILAVLRNLNQRLKGKVGQMVLVTRETTKQAPSIEVRYAMSAPEAEDGVRISGIAPPPGPFYVTERVCFLARLAGENLVVARGADPLSWSLGLPTVEWLTTSSPDDQPTKGNLMADPANSLEVTRHHLASMANILAHAIDPFSLDPDHQVKEMIAIGDVEVGRELDRLFSDERLAVDRSDLLVNIAKAALKLGLVLPNAAIEARFRRINEALGAVDQK